MASMILGQFEVTNALLVALLSIVLHVVNYNVTAQFEYKTRFFTKIFGKNTIYYYAVYLVISALVRDHFVNVCIQQDGGILLLGPFEFTELVGNFLFIFGILLNVWTLKALGIKGMYNGDSFGWLMDAPVTGGPYQFFSDPQYVGTAIACLGTAIRGQSLNGLICTLAVSIVFYISAKYVETPHLNYVYSHRSESKVNFKNLKSLKKMN